MIESRRVLLGGVAGFGPGANPVSVALNSYGIRVMPARATGAMCWPFLATLSLRDGGVRTLAIEPGQFYQWTEEADVSLQINQAWWERHVRVLGYGPDAVVIVESARSAVDVLAPVQTVQSFPPDVIQTQAKVYAAPEDLGRLYKPPGARKLTIFWGPSDAPTLPIEINFAWFISDRQGGLLTIPATNRAVAQFSLTALSIAGPPGGLLAFDPDEPLSVAFATAGQTMKSEPPDVLIVRGGPGACSAPFDLFFFWSL